MMKKAILLITMIQGVLMSATLSPIEINNIKVPIIFEEDKNLPIISMQLIFKNSGFLQDTKGGLVKLSSKLLNEGTLKDGSTGFATKLENRAISLSSRAGAETLILEVDALKEEFEYGLEHLKELLSNPNYSKETLDKIKVQTIGSIKRKESDFDYISSLEMRKMILPDTPLAKPSSGTVKSVKSITIDDVRGYISTHLGLENSIVVIGGDINQSNAIKLLKEILSILPSVKTKEIESMKALGKKQIKEKIVKSEQAYVYFGAPFDVTYDSNERHLAQVADFILGSGGFGSRMMEEIRVKKGLAYSAYSSFVINRTHSYFSGYLQTKIESGEDAVKSVKEVVKIFLEKGITKEELESAKQFILGSQPLRNETLSQRLYRGFKEYYNNRPLGSTTEELKLLEAITIDEINAFIKKHNEISNISFSVVTGEKEIREDKALAVETN